MVDVKNAFFEQRKADLKNRIAINKQIEETLRKKGEVKQAHETRKLITKLEQQMKDLYQKYAVEEIKDETLSFGDVTQ